MSDATPAFVLRRATPEDYDRFVGFFAELGVDDPIATRDVWLASMAPRTHFLEQSGVAVGYALVDVLARTGYVRHVVVDPGARRAGVGAALMRAIASRLRDAGCASWCLNVKRDNIAALALYARVGMATAYESVSVIFPWEGAARLEPPSRAVDASRVGPDDDAAVESAFDLPAGQLAGFRAMPGQVLVALRARGAAGRSAGLVGFARFAPAFPGAFPFRVASPDLASALLAALRPDARPEHATLMLTAENDPALEAALTRAGGDVRMRLRHLRGALDGV